MLTHYWEDRHPDHVNTSRLVSEAVHHSGLAKIKTGQPRYRPQTLLYFKVPANVPPTFVVDISDFIEQRNAAIRAYGSQLFNPASREPTTSLSHPDFLTSIDTIHSYYGTLIGKRKGEAFYLKGVLEIPDLLAHFTSSESRGAKQRNKGVQD